MAKLNWINIHLKGFGNILYSINVDHIVALKPLYVAHLYEGTLIFLSYDKEPILAAESINAIIGELSTTNVATSMANAYNNQEREMREIERNRKQKWSDD